MPTPSAEIIHLLQTFAPAFTAPTFAHACVLLSGTLLAVGPRTVTAALRALGLAHDPHFTTYHRVLNRARWSPLRLSKLLLGLLLRTLLPADAPLVLLVDETLERRRGRKIAYKGYFRDPVRSTAGKTVTSAGLRWLCLALLVPVPWSSRPWALPFLTVPLLAPATSKRLGKRHRTVVERTQLLVRLVRRWQPGRELVLVGDGSYAAVSLGHTCRQQPGRVCLVSRLRLDAALYAPPAPQPTSKRGPKPQKGTRQPNLAARLAADHGVAHRDPAVVRRPAAGARPGEWDGVVASRGGAAPAAALGAPALPRAHHPADRAVLQRPGRQARAAGRLVRRALEHRGHLRGSARAPGRRDAAAVEHPRHRAHHAVPVRPLQPGGRARAGPAPRDPPDSASGVVPQGRGDLRRCTGRRALAFVEPLELRRVRRRPRYTANSWATMADRTGDPVLCRLKGPKSSTTAV